VRWRRGGRPLAGALGVAVTLSAAMLVTQPARAAVAVTLQADKPVFSSTRAAWPTWASA
jgi:hypothetical protein